jgi:hypothetical protein
MAVGGDLSTMPFPELLQWLGGNGRSGLLEVERDKICKRLVLRQGRIVATASNDPREMLGHFLVSRGQITEDLLRIALAQQEETHKPLGVTLVDMGVLTSDELIRNLSAQAEETLFSLFEWDDAVFRFSAREDLPESPFPLDIRVEDVLLRGMQRFDEVRRIRTVFDAPGIVPVRTDKLPPPEVFRNRVARRIYEAIDGERTVAEILLHAHGSEYVVTKFLFELHRTGLLRIQEVRPAPPTGPVADAPEPTPAAAAARRETLPRHTPAAPRPGPSEPPPRSPVRETPGRAVLPNSDGGGAAFRTAFESALEVARTAMARGDFAEALEVLDGLYAEHPNDDSLRRLTQEAEAAFIDKAWKHYLPAERVVALTTPLDQLESQDLTPQEMFLLSRVDGTWTVKSIIQIAPIREVEALRVLKRMRDRGIIDLRDPA